MKTPHLLTALICGSITTASAFSVDFTQHLDAVTSSGPDPAPGSVTPLRTPIIVNVPGYGDISFQVMTGPNVASVPDKTSSSPVTRDFTNNPSEPINALLFADETEVYLRFLGNVPTDIDFDFVGVGIGEDFEIADFPAFGGNVYSIELESSGSTNDGIAGLRSISFNAVPEPSSALLSSFAFLALLRHRR